MTDAEIIRAIRGGNEFETFTAVNELNLKYYERLIHNWAKPFKGIPAEHFQDAVRDAVQATIQAIRDGRLQVDKALWSYLKKAVKNNALDYLEARENLEKFQATLQFERATSHRKWVPSNPDLGDDSGAFADMCDSSPEDSTLYGDKASSAFSLGIEEDAQLAPLLAWAGEFTERQEEVVDEWLLPFAIPEERRVEFFKHLAWTINFLRDIRETRAWITPSYSEMGERLRHLPKHLTRAANAYDELDSETRATLLDAYRARGEGRIGQPVDEEYAEPPTSPRRFWQQLVLIREAALSLNDAEWGLGQLAKALQLARKAFVFVGPQGQQVLQACAIRASNDIPAAGDKVKDAFAAIQLEYQRFWQSLEQLPDIIEKGHLSVSEGIGWDNPPLSEHDEVFRRGVGTLVGWIVGQDAAKKPLPGGKTAADRVAEVCFSFAGRREAVIRELLDCE